MKMGESTRKSVLERIVPLFWSEQSRSNFSAKSPGGIVPGGTGFGANRPGAMLISFAATAKLISVFNFAYAKIRFSHNEAHIKGDFIIRTC